MRARQSLRSFLRGEGPRVLPLPIAKVGYAGGIAQKEFIDEVSYAEVRDALCEADVLPSVVVGEKEYFPKGHPLAFTFTLTKQTAGARVYNCTLPTPKGPLTFEQTFTRRQYPMLTRGLTDNENALAKLTSYLEQVLSRLDDITENLCAVRRQAGEDTVVQVFLPQPFELYCLAGREEAFYLLADGDPDLPSFLEAALALDMALIEKVTACGQADLFFYGSSGTELYSPNLIEEQFMPSSRAITQRIRDCGGYGTYHACGNMKTIFDKTSFLSLQPDILEGIAYAPSGDLTADDLIRVPDCVAFRGNIDLGLLLRGTPDEVYAQARDFVRQHAGRRILLSGACDVLYGTPRENLQALARAAADSNRREQHGKTE